MRVIGIFLVLLNIITLVGPVLGVILAYQDNLKGIVIPPQVENVLSGNSFTGGKIALPQFVEATPDSAGKTVTLVFEFTNPFTYDLMVKSISADVECSLHGFKLGHASLVEPANIPAGATVDLSMRCDWTQKAIDHCHAEHKGAARLDAKLVNIIIEVSGITIQSDQEYPINVPIS